MFFVVVFESAEQANSFKYVPLLSLEKLFCMCYNPITGFAPSYLSEVLHLQSFTISPACSNSNATNAKPIAFALCHTSAPTSGTISSKTSGEVKTFLFSEYFS